jgi:hypothetical protein
MSTNSNHETDSRVLPADVAHQTPAAEADVQGYLIPWHPRIFASEPPPGTTDPYGPPMPGRDMPAHPSFFKPALA